MHRKYFPSRSIAAATFLAAALAVATPTAASAGPAPVSALQVIAQLQRQGDKVIVLRAGDKPLQACTVTAVREGKSEYWWTSPRIVDPSRAKRANGVGTQLMYRTVYVDIQC
ncbi:hypothetical protein [Mycobacteroides salmoniphilum]|uniref:Ig-like domain-containing protein n=1 Tax=Mycobacteroides salmoniphilum TaxID=404941 RepID=A0A4V3I0Y7_9MYCO|nr:hypothetical protein [Mycobacteroides salmoniphilum]TDZ89563.1 hypothetical protein CCUG62472_05008 [Mycobacteroides salmoniphilum]TEA04147.1 hypothetical protein CCUG60884_03011 [Mycobacteroides salmoniphilum]